MKNKAIKKLVSNWEKLVNEGDMTLEAMIESLEDQISGYLDLSAEDLEGDSELAEIMGYDIDNMTDSQIDEWYEIVNEAAIKFMHKHDPIVITEEVKVPGGRYWEPGWEDANEHPMDNDLPGSDELPFD